MLSQNILSSPIQTIQYIRLTGKQGSSEMTWVYTQSKNSIHCKQNLSDIKKVAYIMWSKVEQNGGCVLLFLSPFRCSRLWSCGFSSIRCNTPTVEASCMHISSHLPVQHNHQSKGEAKQKVVHAEPNVLFYNTNRPAALKSTPLPRLLLFWWQKLNSHSMAEKKKN